MFWERNRKVDLCTDIYLFYSMYVPLLYEQTTWHQVDTTILGLDAERAKQTPFIASMGIYVFKREAMLELLETHFKNANDFGHEIIPGAKDLGMKVSEFYFETIVFISIATFVQRLRVVVGTYSHLVHASLLISRWNMR